MKFTTFKDTVLILLLTGLLTMQAWALEQIAELKAAQNRTMGALEVVERILKIP